MRSVACALGFCEECVDDELCECEHHRMPRAELRRWELWQWLEDCRRVQEIEDEWWADEYEGRRDRRLGL